jgi:trk system potassium uptake protein TrkH
VNVRAVGWLLGRVCLLLAGVLLVPGAVGAWYRERAVVEGCLYAAAVGAVAGACLALVCRGALATKGERPDWFRREVLAAVGLAWVAAVLLGALPFLLAGTTSSFADAFFESSSGFTATGSTVFSAQALDALPRGIVFWRAFSHWLGGFGVLVVFVLLFPAGGRGFQRPEVSLLGRESTRARVRDGALVLLRLYVLLTAAHAVLLWALRRDAFDAIVHALSTLAAGGFSSHGNGVLAFASWKVELVLVLFMFLTGVDYGVYEVFQRQGLRAGWRALTHSSEVRAYAGVVVSATLVIAVGLWLWGGSNGLAGDGRPDYSRLSRCLRDSAFSVVSLQSSTGYATADFDRWPDACRLFLLGLIAIGACSGSTGGGLKVVRVLVLWRAVQQALGRFARPRAIRTVRVDGFALDEGTVSAVLLHVGLWLVVVSVSAVLLLAIGFEARPGFADQRILTATSGVVSALSNCGPGLAAVGPWQDWGFFPPVAKILLGSLMLLGRLEFAALLVLFVPRFWRA